MLLTGTHSAGSISAMNQEKAYDDAITRRNALTRITQPAPLSPLPHLFPNGSELLTKQRALRQRPDQSIPFANGAIQSFRSKISAKRQTNGPAYPLSFFNVSDFQL